MTGCERWRFTLCGAGILFVAAIAVGCHSAHDHDHITAHGSEDDAVEVEPLAVTIWTDHHELFVEFPPPVPNEPVRYHAHVTRIEDNHAATEGSFVVRFRNAAGIAAETSIDGVARAGIFTPEGKAPAAGSYGLEMAYTVDGKTDVFDCGTVQVADEPPKQDRDGGGGISFLKESQWKISFTTAWTEERPMAKEIEFSATVEPAASDQLTIGAATGGRFFHNPKIALAEGIRIEQGAVVGTIAPTVAGDDFSRLQFAVEDARLAKEHTQSEIKRIKALVDEGVLPRRRLVALEQDLATHHAELKSARQRLGRVVAPGGAGGLIIKSTLAGIVSQVLVPNGAAVEPGTPLLRLGGSEHLWIRARFVARPASDLLDALPAAVRLPSGERIDLSNGDAHFLSSLPVVDPDSRVATWVVDVSPHSSGGDIQADPSNLRVGVSTVLVVRIGKPRKVLAVPTTAVIDINTRPYVFVQVDGESFDRRAVTLGERDGDFIEVAAGLKKGERIVTVGGFDVHLASLMGAVESHRH